MLQSKYLGIHIRDIGMPGYVTKSFVSMYPAARSSLSQSMSGCWPEVGQWTRRAHAASLWIPDFYCTFLSKRLGLIRDRVRPESDQVPVWQGRWLDWDWLPLRAWAEPGLTNCSSRQQKRSTSSLMAQLTAAGHLVSWRQLDGSLQLLHGPRALLWARHPQSLHCQPPPARQSASHGRSSFSPESLFSFQLPGTQSVPSISTWNFNFKL